MSKDDRREHGYSKIAGIRVSLGNTVAKNGSTGGQTVYGGVGVSDDFTLNSTSNSTKGDVIIAEGLSTFNEADSTITHIGSVMLNQENTPIVKDTDTTGLDGTSGIHIVNGYAYVTSTVTSKLSIFDISDSSSIVAKDSITTGLNVPDRLFVAGKYAYVISGGNNTFAIFDISDPDSIVARDTTTTGLNSPFDVYVVGRYAYIINQGGNTLSIFDIADPDNIVTKDTITTGLSSPRRIYVTGIYAYVTSSSNNTFAIFDVSDADNIVAKDTITTGLSDPRGIYVVNRYAYVISNVNNTLAIFDVSDPAAIVAKDTITTNLSGPREVYVTGKYAYVSNAGNDTCSIYDISDPDAIVAKSIISTGLDRPQDIYVAGNNIYIANFDNDTFAIFEIVHFNIPAIKSGGIRTNDLDVSNRADINGYLNIAGGLSVGNTARFDDKVSIDEDLDLYSGHLRRSTTASITASTTQTQGQQPLVTDINEVSVVANANDTVTMPLAASGMEIFIINNGANTLQIFPASGDNLEAGVDTAVTLASGSNVTYVAYDATNWEVK